MSKHSTFRLCHISSLDLGQHGIFCLKHVVEHVIVWVDNYLDLFGPQSKQINLEDQCFLLKLSDLVSLDDDGSAVMSN